MRYLSSLIALVFLASGASAAENWVQFRGPNSSGHAESSKLPLTWSESENVKWKTEIPGKAWSSPVVWDDQVWVTNAPEDGKQLSAVCVDRDSGKILHDVVVFEYEKPQFCHKMNSYATPTPTIEKGRLYVHYGSHGTACLDTASGKILWKRNDLECDHFRGAASSPVLHKENLILVFDGFDYQYVVGLDKQTGKTVWRRDRNDDFDYRTNNGDAKKAYGTPLVIQVAGKAQVVCPGAMATVVYDPVGGKTLWNVRHGGMNVSAVPMFDGKTVFINSGGGKLLAVNPDGKGDVSATKIRWESKKGIPKRPSQVLHNGLITMMNDSGVATCLEAASGKVVWQERMGDEYCASPILANGRIYFFSRTGNCPVIAASRKFELLAENKLDGGFMASPAVAGNALFLRTKTHLYCVGK